MVTSQTSHVSLLAVNLSPVCAGDTVIRHRLDFTLCSWFHTRLLCNSNIRNHHIYIKGKGFVVYYVACLCVLKVLLKQALSASIVLVKKMELSGPEKLPVQKTVHTICLARAIRPFWLICWLGRMPREGKMPSVRAYLPHLLAFCHMYHLLVLCVLLSYWTLLDNQTNGLSVL